MTKSVINTTISLVFNGTTTQQVIVKPGLNYVNFGGQKECIDFLVCQVLTPHRVVELESLSAWYAGILDSQESRRPDMHETRPTHEFYQSLEKHVKEDTHLGSLEAVVLVGMVGKSGVRAHRGGPDFEHSFPGFGQDVGNEGGHDFDQGFGPEAGRGLGRGFGPETGRGFGQGFGRKHKLKVKRIWAKKLVQSMIKPEIAWDAMNRTATFCDGLRIVVDVVRCDTPEAKYEFLLLGQATVLDVACEFDSTSESLFKAFVSSIESNKSLFGNIGVLRALLCHAPTLETFDQVWALASTKASKYPLASSSSSSLSFASTFGRKDGQDRHVSEFDLLRQAATTWALQASWLRKVGALVSRVGVFTWEVCKVLEAVQPDPVSASKLIAACVKDAQETKGNTIEGFVGDSKTNLANWVVKWFGSWAKSESLSRVVEATEVISGKHPSVNHQHLLLQVDAFRNASARELCVQVKRVGNDLNTRPGLLNVFVRHASREANLSTILQVTTAMNKEATRNGFAVNTLQNVLEFLLPTSFSTILKGDALSMQKLRNLVAHAESLCEVAKWLNANPHLSDSELAGRVLLRRQHVAQVDTMLTTKQIPLRELRVVLDNKKAVLLVNKTFGLEGVDLDAITAQVDCFDAHMELVFQFRKAFALFVDAHLASLVECDRESFSFQKVLDQLVLLETTKSNYQFERVLALKTSPGFVDMMNKSFELSSDLVQHVIPQALRAWDSLCSKVLDRSIGTDELELYKLHTWESCETVSPLDDTLKAYLSRRKVRDDLPGFAALLDVLKVDPTLVLDLHKDILATSTSKMPLRAVFTPSLLFDQMVSTTGPTMELLGTLGKAINVATWLGAYPEQTLFDSKLLIARSTGAIDNFVAATEALRRIRTELANLWYGQFSNVYQLLESMPKVSLNLLADARLLSVQGAMLVDALDSQDSLDTKTKELTSLTEFVVQVVNDDVHLFARSTSNKPRYEPYLDDLVASLQVTSQSKEVSLFCSKLKQAREYRDLVSKLIQEGFPQIEKFNSVNNFCTTNLNSELVAWQHHVNSARRKYYFLNFYTIKEIWRISSLISSSSSSSSTPSTSSSKALELRHLLRVVTRHDDQMVDALLADTKDVKSELDSIGEWLARHVKSFPGVDAGKSRFMLMANPSDAIWLCVPNEDQVFETTLSVFVHNNRLPYPGEVVFCGADTTRETLSLAIARFARAGANDMLGLVTCLVNPDKLTFDIQAWLASQVEQALTANPGTLVLVATDKTSYIATALSSHFVPQLLASNTHDVSADLRTCVAKLVRNQVVCLTSEHEGAGKTLRARQLSIPTRFV